jgi:hypothetical protein
MEVLSALVPTNIAWDRVRNELRSGSFQHVHNGQSAAQELKPVPDR